MGEAFVLVYLLVKLARVSTGESTYRNMSRGTQLRRQNIVDAGHLRMRRVLVHAV